MATVEARTVHIGVERVRAPFRSHRPTRRGHRGWRRQLGLVKLIAFDGRTESRRNEVVHLAGSRMSLDGRLRKQQLAVERHLETASAARQQRRTGDSRRPRIEEFSHQTGGSIRVVSDDAELDLEFVRLVGGFCLHVHTLRRETCRSRAPTPTAHRADGVVR